MSKAQQKESYNATKGLQAQNNQNAAVAGGQLNSILGTAQSTAGDILPGAASTYADIANTGGGDLGIPAESVVAMKDEASQAARATYDVGADEAKRAISATGGYGVSGSITGNLARKGSEAASRAAVNTDASIAGMQQQGKMANVSNKLTAASGLTNIYGMNEAQISTTVDQILKNYQQTGQLNNQDMTILTNLSNQPGVFDKIVGTIGTLGDTAAGIMKALP